MDIMILSEKANEYCVEVNKLLQKLEDIDSRIKGVDGDTTVCLFTEIGGKAVGTTKVDDILTPELMAELETKVFSAMERVRFDVESKLLDLIQFKRQAAVPNPELEAAIKEMESQSKSVSKSGRKTVKLDVEKVTDMYSVQGLSYKKIGELCCCAEGTVYNFIKKHAIKKLESEVKAPSFPEMTIDEVKKVYTNGSMSMAEAAKYFGIGAGVLYKFVEDNGLKKTVIKSKDPFTDKNRMGKEEFAKRMIADRKK